MISLHFYRNFLSIFMVVYLPTILMNTINQATNYIPTSDKYELIYTINSNCGPIYSIADLK